MFPYGTSGIYNPANPGNLCCGNPGSQWVSAILPDLEQQALFSALNFSLWLGTPANTTVTRTVVANLMCPSDPGIITPMKPLDYNAGPGMGLWYPGNMGGTLMDALNPACVANPNVGNTNVYCNTGYYGNKNGTALVGMFARSNLCQRMGGVLDGLSNTIMVGETLPDDCSRIMGAFAQNFPLSGTQIPLNQLSQQDPGQWWMSCGYKSHHAGGANFLMGDGSTRFVKQSVNYFIYNALGSSRGGEVISGDQF